MHATVNHVIVKGTAYVGMVLGAVLITSCSSSEATVDYDEQTRDGFMAACADSVEDSQLVSSVCDCVYLEVENTFSYAELAQLQTPVADTTDQDEEIAAPLADEITEIVADCVVDEATLDG